MMNNISKKISVGDRHQSLIKTAFEQLGPDSPEMMCATTVLDDARFTVWTGSLNGKHHYGSGGLVKHTEEVLTFALSLASCNPYLELPSVDRKTLTLAVIFHDYGKLWDYEPVLDQFTEDVSNPGKPEYLRRRIIDWKGTAHKRLTHHVTRSNMEWLRASEFEEVDPARREAVSHAILAHHGCREWGSPVSPGTAEAWILHLADMASARQEEISRGVDHLEKR